MLLKPYAYRITFWHILLKPYAYRITFWHILLKLYYMRILEKALRCLLRFWGAPMVFHFVVVGTAHVMVLRWRCFSLSALALSAQRGLGSLHLRT